MSSNLMDFEKFVEYCKNKSVAIVGPAQIENSLKEEIDNHDIVVRINNYERLDPQKYGSKTDVICFNFYRATPVVSTTNPPEWLLNTHRLFFVPDTKEWIDISLVRNSTIKHSIFPTSENEYNYANTYKYHTTSGYCVLLNFLQIIKHLKKLNIYALTLNLTSHYNPNYSDSTGDRMSCHNMKYEREHMKEVIARMDREDKSKLHFHCEICNSYFKSLEE